MISLISCLLPILPAARLSLLQHDQRVRAVGPLTACISAEG